MATNKHWVDFPAHKKVKEEIRVSFPTKEGVVSFPAHKKVVEEVEVRFKAKNEKQK